MNKPKHIDINNRKALYDYELLDKYDNSNYTKRYRNKKYT